MRYVLTRHAMGQVSMVVGGLGRADFNNPLTITSACWLTQVPLVRSRYKKKYCVICQKCYTDEPGLDSDDKVDSESDVLREASMVNRGAKEVHRINENDAEVNN